MLWWRSCTQRWRSCMLQLTLGQPQKKKKKKIEGNSLLVQCLDLCTFTAEGTGSIPGGGSRILQAACIGQETQTNNNKKWQTWKPEQNKKCIRDIFPGKHTDKYMKRWSTPLIIREKQTKTTMKYHLTPVRIAKNKKTRKNKCWWGCGKKRILVHW